MVHIRGFAVSGPIDSQWSMSSGSKNTLAFGAVMGGKLTLKGDKPKKKKKRAREDDGEADDEPLDLPEYSSDPVVGTGKLSSSGVVVMGHDTDFTKELEIGDTLHVTIKDRFRNTETDESRIVNMMLGKTSLNIEAPFSCDITAPSSFMFIKRKPDVDALKACHAPPHPCSPSQRRHRRHARDLVAPPLCSAERDHCPRRQRGERSANVPRQPKSRRRL